MTLWTAYTIVSNKKVHVDKVPVLRETDNSYFVENECGVQEIPKNTMIYGGLRFHFSRLEAINFMSNDLQATAEIIIKQAKLYQQQAQAFLSLCDSDANSADIPAA